jgi:hypothetical protein
MRPSVSHPSIQSFSLSASNDPKPIDITSYCIGTPETIANSNSNNISLSLSLQEDIIFLSYPQTSSFSYSEQDLGSNIDPHTPNFGDPNEDFPDRSPSSITNPFLDDRFSKVTPRQSLHNSSLGPNSSPTDMPPSILQGSLLLKISKPTKIKDISLRFYGKYKTGLIDANTDPKLIDTSLPSGPQFQDELIVGSHTWEFFPTPEHQSTSKSSIITVDSASVVSSDLYGADVAYLQPHQNVQLLPNTTATLGNVSFKTPINSELGKSSTLTPTISHLSKNNIPFLSPVYFEGTKFQQEKSENHTFAGTREQFTLYPAGDYVFHFNLAIDARMAETIICPKAALKYYLVAKVERPSRFSFAITGHKEITLVRSPPALGETLSNMPLAISRDWDQRLHYDISCPKKYITLGTSIPLTIKLTPIEKVRVHRVKVEVVESLLYSSAKLSRLKHRDPLRKVLVFEKFAKGPMTSTQNDKDSEKESEKKRKNRIAMMCGNLLHFSEDPAAEHSKEGADGNMNQIADTTELDVDMPFVTSDSDWNSLATHHFTNPSSDSKYFQFLRPDVIFNPLVHIKHRLHVSFRISKLDSGSGNWRYFEVLIDTPIHFLSKYCKSESVELPNYEDLDLRYQPKERQQQQRDNLDDDELELDPNSTLSGATTNSSSSARSIPIPVNSPSGIPLKPRRSNQSSTIGFGSPLVRTLSSPFSNSPLTDGVQYLSLDDHASHPLMDQLPSFDDAISDRICGTRPGAPQSPRLNRAGAEDAEIRSISSALSEDITSQDTASSLSGRTSLLLPPGYETIREASSVDIADTSLLEGSGPPTPVCDDIEEEEVSPVLGSSLLLNARYDIPGAQL